MKKQWIVNLRAIACIFIVLLHSVYGWIDVIDINNLSNVRLFFDVGLIPVIVRTGVPIFLMISGSLLLDQNKNVNFDKIKKYIIRMLLVLLIFGFGFCFLEQLFILRFSNISLLLINSIKNFIYGNSWSHMWYIYSLIGIYLLTPIIKSFINNFDKKEQMKILFLLIIICLVIPTINNLCSFNITTFGIQGFEYILMYVLGYYVLYDTNLTHNKYYYLIGIQGFILGLLFSKQLYLSGGMQTSIFNVMFSIGIFRFSSNHIDHINSGVINLISKYSFSIYLIHPIFLNVVMKVFNIYIDFFPVIVGELIFCTISIALSLLVSYIICKIPILKKILY